MTSVNHSDCTPRGARIIYLSPDDQYREDNLSRFIRLLNPKTANVPEELVGEISSWRSWMPVLIQAGTGTGKSTFVLETLCSRAREEGKTVLIVSNRIALNTQYKRQLIRLLEPHKEKELTPVGIQCLKTVGHVTVASYQGLRSLTGNRSHFDYVVFDEAHYFTSDALFAEDTGALLRDAAEAFRNSIRVYMTATPWAVQNRIAEVEKKIQPPLLKRLRDCGSEGYFSIYEKRCILASMGLPYNWDSRVLENEPHELKLYRFPDKPRDYRLHWLPANFRDDRFCKGMSALINDIPAGEKVVIFVTSKKQGKQLAKELGNAAYLDAESKSGNVWEQLTNMSRFQESVLITTSVADCGLNIIDPAVRHIVLFSTDHVQFMQELGRVRLKDGESLNVYVPALSRSQLDRLRNDNERRYQSLKEFQELPPSRLPGQRFMEWWSEDPVIRHLIPIDGVGRLHTNECAKTLIVQRRLAYKELIKMEDAGEKEPFLRMVCQWLGNPDLGIDDYKYLDDQETYKQELIAFLQDNVGHEFTNEEEQEKFADKLKELRYRAYGPRKEDNKGKDRRWGAKIIQRELEALKLPFILEATKDGWRLMAKEPSASEEIGADAEANMGADIE